MHPKGAAPFDVALDEVPLTAAPSAKPGGPALVHVTAPLEFDALASDVRYFARRSVDSGGGLVRLVKGTVVDHVRSQAGYVVGDVVFDQDESLDRQNNLVITDKVVARGQALACSVLDVDDTKRPGGELVPVDPKTSYFAPVGRTLAFFPRPGAGPKLELKVGDPDQLYLAALAERPSALRLELRYQDGSRVAGWVARSAVRPTQALNVAGKAGAGVGCGVGRDYIPVPGTYEGPADVRSGARVFSGQGTGRWARVAPGPPLHVRVLHTRGQAFAMILALPGISDNCNLMDHAFVARSDVSFPPSAGPR